MNNNKTKSKLLYDLAATHPGKLGSKHGGGVYAEAVFEQLVGMNATPDFDVFYFSHKQLPQNIKQLCDSCGVIQHRITNSTDIQKLIDSDNYHTLYSALPYELYQNVNTENVRFVYTVHGLREIEVPYSIQQWRYSKHWKRTLEWLWATLFTTHYLKSTKARFENLLRKKNSQVITISQHSKFSILNHFGDIIQARDLKVLYSPLLTDKVTCQAATPQQNSKRDYFLIINGNRWIKNSYRALCALEKFYARNPECIISTLVLGLETAPKRFRNNPHFVFKGYVSREELELAYSNAFAFIYPTLNEGFGYPPLEAMRKKTPVLASAVAAVPEVCGDAVSYFNPLDVDEIAIRIAEIYHDRNRYQALVDKGYDRVNEIDSKQAEMLEQLCTMIVTAPDWMES